MEVQELERMIGQQTAAKSNVFKALMRKVYLWMTLALVITGITAAGVAGSPNMLALIYGNSMVMWGMVIAELALVFYVTARINKLSLGTATLLFIIYSILNGAMLSSIFLVYTTATISKVFFITAGTFGATAFYGYATKKDLSSMGSILFMVQELLTSSSGFTSFPSPTMLSYHRAGGLLRFCGSLSSMFTYEIITTTLLEMA